ncbi:sigma-54 interacting transcriptional regulator [Marinobacterium halophilum]|uniref:Sigma-54 interacting transcriptional regulator n=1 Tax=Marinobacterium halophilum TaxID=267374 RepID=A0A2P8EUF3_9GAMM|nr:sigma-54 dependent transcriptional regulator [Marinobacterium halophilum]PSL13099.1 sigma-54 interacting transcriptional regulator [Marinobacterium halophilum]
MFKKRILLTWLGRHDLDAEASGQSGPIASILLAADAPFDEVHILANAWFDELDRYQRWLAGQSRTRNAAVKTTIHISSVELTSPIHYPDIYAAARSVLDTCCSPNALVTLNLSSGTPAMAAIWLLLGKGVYNTRLVQTSIQDGVIDVELPFDIALAYLEHQDGVLGSLAGAPPKLDSHFEHIQTHSPAMHEAVSLAKRLAPRNLPVIVQGESGTGKEVIARAIHEASPRAAKPFIPVNCGAIPEGLIDSQLFGHRKGAFTGADANRKGFFDEADGGTLFLDEVGELPLEAQVKLLRALQQKEINPVGASKPHAVDVRVITATHRNLLSMVEEGAFREDLFYRLAVGVVGLPPLRARHEDIPELVTSLLGQLNLEAKDQPGYASKIISEDAMDFIKQQRWPGNIRELWNTLLRASIWADTEVLDTHEIERALIQRPRKTYGTALDIDVAEGVDINEILDNTKRYCVLEALKTTAGQKGKAAELLGLKNHQTLNNWIKQLGIEEY